MMSAQPDSVPVVDLFAGAGGLSIGAREAGADVRLAVELDPVACETLLANSASAHATHVVLEADVTSLTGRELRRRAGLARRDPLLIVGGAPCQPFSKAAYWTEAGDDAAFRRARAAGLKDVVRPAAPTVPRSDSRRSLVDYFAHLVVESEADGFLFENVPAIVHPRNRPMLDRLVRVLGAADHKITVAKVNAVSYGVPQRRERVFVLGSKASTPALPVPTHRTTSEAMLETDSYLQPMPTAGEACAPFTDASYTEVEEVVRGRWADHLKTVPPGWNYKAHTAWAGHPNPTFVTETRFWNFLLKLSPDLPSWTIAATPGPWTGPFHWDSRRLRVPELAALQGFPSDYKLVGSRRERVRQLGNAVPPPVARAMVGAVLATLARPDDRAARRVS